MSNSQSIEITQDIIDNIIPQLKNSQTLIYKHTHKNTSCDNGRVATALREKGFIFTLRSSIPETTGMLWWKKTTVTITYKVKKTG